MLFLYLLALAGNRIVLLRLFGRFQYLDYGIAFFLRRCRILCKKKKISVSNSHLTPFHPSARSATWAVMSRRGKLSVNHAPVDSPASP